jgi:peptidoglycan hydrolase-like protein with peptidoglycan-binding domain
MLLENGDKGDNVKGLQRGLNRLGSLLVVDGNFGGSTETAVLDARAALGLPIGSSADDALIAALAHLPEPSALTAPGITFIGLEEVSSAAEYRTRYKSPVWPSAQSGITIGIGYDLRFANAEKLNADWGAVLSPDLIARLAAVSGQAGSKELLGKVRNIEIPLLIAAKVFVQHSIPNYIAQTRIIYPQVDRLTPQQVTALVSLVYNRGTSLDGDSRLEMKNIQDLLAGGKLDQVPEQFESMTRLWPGLPGLIDRRRREAALWRDGFVPLQLA